MPLRYAPGASSTPCGNSPPPYLQGGYLPLIELHFYLESIASCPTSFLRNNSCNSRLRYIWEKVCHDVTEILQIELNLSQPDTQHLTKQPGIPFFMRGLYGEVLSYFSDENSSVNVALFVEIFSKDIAEDF